MDNATCSFDLSAYLDRVGLAGEEDALRGDLPAALTKVMAAQMRSIAFENIDVVLGKAISMDPTAVEEKLVGDGRGGYCFEQNTLLRLALQALGFVAAPLLCRVRWGKAADVVTTFTHMALRKCLQGKQAHIIDHPERAVQARTGSYIHACRGS
jgi:N-hydroxyarylamine O-acetyltransferase